MALRRVPCFLHSFVDVKTHEFFLERDYPAPEVLARVEKAIPEGGSRRLEPGARPRRPATELPPSGMAFSTRAEEPSGAG